MRPVLEGPFAPVTNVSRPKRNLRSKATSSGQGASFGLLPELVTSQRGSVCSTTSSLTRPASGVTYSRVIEQLIELGTVESLPTYDNRIDLVHIRDIRQRINIQQHQVGCVAALDMAPGFRQSEEDGWVGRGGFERLHRTQPGFNKQFWNQALRSDHR